MANISDMGYEKINTQSNDCLQMQNSTYTFIVKRFPNAQETLQNNKNVVGIHKEIMC